MLRAFLNIGKYAKTFDRSESMSEDKTVQRLDVSRKLFENRPVIRKIEDSFIINKS